MQEIQNEPCLEDGVCVADVMIFAEEGRAEQWTLLVGFEIAFFV